MLNEYVSACELLSDRSTYLCAHMDEFDSMLEGVVKSSICDVKLENSGSLARVDVVIPNDVRTFVKTK